MVYFAGRSADGSKKTALAPLKARLGASIWDPADKSGFVGVFRCRVDRIHEARSLKLTYLSTGGSMNIRPLHDRVIVKREAEERKSPGGIVIPDTATEKPIFGKVVAVGKGKSLEDGKIRPLDINVGDKILFGKYSGTEVKMEGDELVVMREGDVMAVIEA
jgi:chaperonin GroES